MARTYYCDTTRLQEDITRMTQELELFELAQELFGDTLESAHTTQLKKTLSPLGWERVETNNGYNIRKRFEKKIGDTTFEIRRKEKASYGNAGVFVAKIITEYKNFSIQIEEKTNITNRINTIKSNLETKILKLNNAPQVELLVKELNDLTKKIDELGGYYLVNGL